MVVPVEWQIKHEQLSDDLCTTILSIWNDYSSGADNEDMKTVTWLITTVSVHDWSILDNGIG